MHTKALVSTSVLALAIVGVSVNIVSGIYNDSQDNSPLTTKTKEIPKLSASEDKMPTEKTSQDTTPSPELIRIKKELAQLRNEMAALASLKKDTDINQVQEVLREEKTPEQVEEAMQGMQATFEQQLQIESVDTEWASETIASVQESFSNEELSGIDLVDVSCGSTLCKVNLEIAPDLPMEESLQLLSTHRSWDGATFVSVDENGQPKLFFARSGYELPQGDF